MREIDNRVTMLRIWTDGKMDRIGQPGIFLSLIFKIKLLKILFIYITKNVLYLFRIIILYIFIFFKMVREESKCDMNRARVRNGQNRTAVYKRFLSGQVDTNGRFHIPLPSGGRLRPPGPGIYTIPYRYRIYPRSRSAQCEFICRL